MPKKKISITVDSKLVDSIDAIAAADCVNRSECIEKLLSQAVGDDGSGRIEFFQLVAPAEVIQKWMRQEKEFFNDLRPGGEPMELVFRVTRRQWDDYFSKRGMKRRFT